MTRRDGIEGAGRLELARPGGRRRWSDEEKVRIVEESLAGRRQASATARRHGIDQSLIFRWRQQYREGRLGRTEPGTAEAFIPAYVAPAEALSGGRIEIVTAGGHRVIVGADVDLGALGTVLDALGVR
jgi:transposase